MSPAIVVRTIVRAAFWIAVGFIGMQAARLAAIILYVATHP